MTKLTKKLLAATYDMLSETEPFNTWNLPHSDDISFVVGRTKTLRGHYIKRRQKKYEIMISKGTISHTNNVVMTMAHEMIHLFQATTGKATASSGQHNEAFTHFAKEVCRIHGWDPKLF